MIFHFTTVLLSASPAMHCAHLVPTRTPAVYALSHYFRLHKPGLLRQLDNGAGASIPRLRVLLCTAEHAVKLRAQARECARRRRSRRPGGASVRFASHFDCHRGV